MAVTGETTAKIAALEAEIRQHHADIKPLLIDFYEAYTGDEINDTQLNAADAALENLYQAVLIKEDQIASLKQIQTESQAAKPDLVAWLRMTDWLH